MLGITKQVVVEVTGDENLRRDGKLDKKNGKEDNTDLSWSRNLNDLS